MTLGEILVHMANYNFTKFHQNLKKNNFLLLIARFSVQNFKVAVESRKSYIVHSVKKIKKKTLIVPFLWILVHCMYIRSFVETFFLQLSSKHANRVALSRGILMIDF